MFLLEYIKNPRKVGAVAPSSKYLAYEMINTINFENTNCILEYGPGTGSFTEKILARVKEDTIVILIEVNKEFYNTLKNLYGHKKNVIILNESAENISNNILNRNSEILGETGEFITFQYTLFKEKYIESFFNRVKHRRVIRNFPPAYVLRCNGGKNEAENIGSR